MKNFKYCISTSQIAVLFFFILAMACTEETDELSLSRQFSPSKISSTNEETQVTIAWSSSLFTTVGEVSYAVEISDNVADFATPVLTTTVSTAGIPATATEIGIVVTDDKLEIKKDYYARVKALGTEDREDSNWLVSTAFRILGEQYLLPVTTENVIDKAVRLSWKASNDLTKIVIMTPAGTSVDVVLTDADRTATMRQINSLNAATTYTAEIFAGAKSKGTQVFTTKPAIVGNVIDLRDISLTAKPNILLDTLPDIAPGSVVLLKRGEAYNIASAYSFDKTMTIQSGLDFGSNLAAIYFPTTNSFNIADGSVIDSLVFKDLIFKGTQPNFASYTSSNSNYIINANKAATVDKIRLENCTIKILRGVVRAQAGSPGMKIANYFVNNCVLDSIREYGIATASSTSAFANIKITNTTMSRARRFIVHSVAGNASITIENCTFNELVAGTASPASNYFIDLNTFNSTNGISIKNTIFGKVWDETGAGTFIEGIRMGSSTAANVINSYNTSDFVNSGSKPIPGLSAYSGTAAALFTDPNNDNFKIKDANFIGKSSAGDPRWR